MSSSAIPVGHAVLMPGDRAAEAGLFDKIRVVERDEVVAVDRGGDAEQMRVTVEPQGGGDRLAIPNSRYGTISGVPASGSASVILAGGGHRAGWCLPTGPTGA